MARKPTQLVQLKIRIQEQLRREVEKRAKKSGRTLTGEIAALLEVGLEAGDWKYLKDSLDESSQRLSEQIEISRELQLPWTPEELEKIFARRRAGLERQAKEPPRIPNASAKYLSE